MEGESFEIISNISEPTVNVIGNSASASMDDTFGASPGYSVNQTIAEAERPNVEQHNHLDSFQIENHDSLSSLVSLNRREVTGVDSQRITTLDNSTGTRSNTNNVSQPSQGILNSDLLPGRGETFSSLAPMSDGYVSRAANPLNDISQVMSGLSNSEVENLPHQSQRTTRPLESDIYGKLILLGTNGTDGGCEFVLSKRAVPNGFDDGRQVGSVNVPRSEGSQIIFSGIGGEVEVIEMKPDSRFDLFQIGRQQDEKIDFRVDERNMQPGGPSNVSRFACRIQVNRETGEARIYAAGFDHQNRIFLGEYAKQWRLRYGKMDGLTTNGVWVCFKTNEAVDQESSASQLEKWREVSVTGKLYPCIPDRGVTREQCITNESNVLQDFSIIDLAGVTMIWRTKQGLQQLLDSHCQTQLRQQRNSLQENLCPVSLEPFQFRLNCRRPQPGNVASVIHNIRQHDEQNADRDSRPWVFTNCGHVISECGQAIVNHCPLCRTEGSRLRLRIGMEPSFWNDANPRVTHYFTSCGHAIGENAAKFWSKLHNPRNDVGKICPFCATPLSVAKPYGRLYFS